jgi:histidinol phosphatase-like enzyme
LPDLREAFFETSVNLPADFTDCRRKKTTINQRARRFTDCRRRKQHYISDHLRDLREACSVNVPVDFTIVAERRQQ